MTPTEQEVADVYHSLMSVSYMHGKIYGTDCATVIKVLRFWGRLGQDEFKRIETMDLEPRFQGAQYPVYDANHKIIG